MIEDGADIIDVGGYSSRPGAQRSPIEEEKTGYLNALRIISREFPETIISVDTFRIGIAQEAVLECGAGMINDISGGEADKNVQHCV